MSEMIYRTLGNTGLEVSVIGFGAAPLGNEYAEIDVETGTRAVHAAIERGVNLFDTSPYNGRTLSETRLGEALVGKRDKVILATKCGRYDRDLPHGFDFSAERLTRSIEESLARLKTDVIDIYQLHDIEFTEERQVVEEALPALAKMREQGKIRFIGITGYPLPLLMRVAEQVPVDTILSYSHYNLLITTLDDELAPFAAEHGIGLMNASALHMGALTEGAAPDWHPAPARIHAAVARAAQIARKHGTDIMTLAVQFVLGYTGAATTLIGMRTEAEVNANLGLVGSTPDTNVMAAVQAELARVKDVVWQSGLPQHFEPGAVAPGGE